MGDVTENLLQSRWSEYQRLLAVHASYAALVRLAEMDNVLSQEGATWPIPHKWVVIVQNETIPDELYRKALAEAEQNVSRLKRILGVGTNFTHEEMVLAITLRVELQLLAELLLKRRGAIEFAPDLADEDLREISRYSQNVSAFRAAKATAKRNWGIPIRSSWFE
ncbi:hypothetical protein [Bradyrhizobium murdochi]|uniref:hypothetical protein n=1 Tax=Bradyrhizobium murdochi TaxID=1038859 RepID=UPI0004817CD0|nr:hypothetical protein [Bradyrhizobium murdochi]